MRHLVGLLAISLLSATPLSAQRAIPPGWGTLLAANHVIGAWEFEPYLATSTPLTGMNFGERGGGSPGQTYVAHFHLPSGALVQMVEITGCDNNPASEITATVYAHGVGGSEINLGSAATGVSTTGCNFYTVSITPFTVDNYSFTYAVHINLGAPAGNTFSNVRLWYKLQVSPAPVTATFADVPTNHLFFQYIQALASSGITAGCTAPPNPNFCPDAPLTRGQMAVFLSRALGLHFAP